MLSFLLIYLVNSETGSAASPLKGNPYLISSPSSPSFYVSGEWMSSRSLVFETSWSFELSCSSSSVIFAWLLVELLSVIRKLLRWLPRLSLLDDKTDSFILTEELFS